MSIIKSNLITEGLSGKIGKNYTFVHKSNGTTFIRRIPCRSKVVSKQQLAHQAKFALVIKQAKEAIANPAMRVVFEAQTEVGNNVFCTAVKHFWKKLKEE